LVNGVVVGAAVEVFDRVAAPAHDLHDEHVGVVQRPSWVVDEVALDGGPGLPLRRPSLTASAAPTTSRTAATTTK
jgi:hypothetical protein